MRSKKIMWMDKLGINFDIEIGSELKTLLFVIAGYGVFWLFYQLFLKDIVG